MNTSEIPLVPSQPQNFSVTLGGVAYIFNLYWLEALGKNWNLDISDVNGNQLVVGVPLLPGNDILAQHTTIGFPGQLWVDVDYNADAVPGFDDLGVNAHLYFIQL